MSEHVWVLENLAAFVADGLDTAERDQLERHVADCPDCARALDAARAADRRLLAVFAEVRPGPALEDQLIRTLRQAVAPRPSRRWSGWGRVVLATAAAAVIAVCGAGIGTLLEEGNERTDGAIDKARTRVANQLKQLGIAAQSGEGRPMTAGNGAVDGVSNTTEFTDADQVADVLRQQSHLGTLDDSASVKLKDGLDNFRKDLEVLGQDFDGEVHFKVGRKPNVSQQGLQTFSETTTGNQQGKKGLAPVDTPPPGVLADHMKWSDSNGKQSNLREGGGAKADNNKEPGRGSDEKGQVGGEGKSASMGPYFKPGDVFANGEVAGKGKELKEVQERVAEESKANQGKLQAGDDGKAANEGEVERLAKQLKDLDKATPQSEQGPEQKAKSGAPEPEPGAGPQKIIIRSGEIDFEVDSFDAAVAVVQKLVAGTKGGYIATINSDKLPNGKVKGSVVVRVPPDQLDGLVLDLRKDLAKTGELKGQRIGSQDITKAYTDLQSRLKAAKTMQERLQRIIKDGKGEIKDLVAAEKELGVWLTKIEELEGELRYYGNLVALSTLTINLMEKNISVAAAVAQSERVQAGVEVEDVEKAMRDLLAAVTDAKGRVTRSEMKQLGARQFNAQMEFEVAPAKAGPIRDRIRQLGIVARLEIDRVQTAEGGTKLPKDGRLETGNTRFFVSLYNLANIEPRETVTVKVATRDVAAAYRALHEAVEKARGHVVNADLNEQDPQNVCARLDFDVRRVEQGVVQTALTGLGDVLARHVARAPEGENRTDTKVLYRVELVPATAVEPREFVAMAVEEVADVPGAVSVLTAQVKEVQGRVVKGPLTASQQNGRVTARVVYDVPLAVAPAIVEKVKQVGKVRVSQEAPNPQAPDGKFAVARIEVTLTNAELLVPRDEGLWAQVQRGLSISFRGLSVSVSFLIIGVLFVLPWLVLIGAIVWIARRIWRPAVVVQTATGPAPTPTATPGGAG
jgi:hypothetical protein